MMLSTATNGGRKRIGLGKPYLWLALGILALLIAFPLVTHGNELSDDQQILLRLEQTQGDINAHVAALKASIANLQVQIRSTQAQLTDTQASISNLNTQIADLETKIALDKAIIAKLIQQLYAQGDISSLEMLASSDDFGDFLNKSAYLDQVRQNVSDTLKQIRDLKAQLENNKADLVAKQEQLTNLKNQQYAQQASLNAQLAQQNQISSLNKKQMSSYQARIAQLVAEEGRYESSFCGRQYSPVGTAVSEGQVIGYEGMSGAATGPHVHFEVHSGGACVNPQAFINSGQMRIPMDGCGGYSCMTQPFGHTSFESFHTGIDLAKPSGTPVRAATDGVIVLRSMDHVSSCSQNTWPNYVSAGCYVVVWHPSINAYSLYAHLSGFAS